MDDIAAKIMEFVLQELLPGEDPSHLDEDTPLLSTGVLDSVGIVMLIAFLEQRFGVVVHAREIRPDRFETIAAIAETVRSKVKRP